MSIKYSGEIDGFEISQDYRSVTLNAELEYNGFDVDEIFREFQDEILEKSSEDELLSYVDDEKILEECLARFTRDQIFSEFTDKELHEYIEGL